MPEAAGQLMREGYAARKEHRLGDAQKLFTEAIISSHAAGESAVLAQSLTGLGQIERDLGNNTLALQHYGEAVALYRNLNAPLLLAHAVRHLADIGRNIGSYQQARLHYQEVLAIHREHEVSELEQANTQRGLALLLEATGEPAGARSAWNDAKRLYQAAGIEAGVDESAGHLAKLA